MQIICVRVQHLNWVSLPHHINRKLFVWSFYYRLKEKITSGNYDGHKAFWAWVNLTISELLECFIMEFGFHKNKDFGFHQHRYLHTKMPSHLEYEGTPTPSTTTSLITWSKLLCFASCSFLTILNKEFYKKLWEKKTVRSCSANHGKLVQQMHKRSSSLHFKRRADDNMW